MTQSTAHSGGPLYRPVSVKWNAGAFLIVEFSVGQSGADQVVSPIVLQNLHLPFHPTTYNLTGTDPIMDFPTVDPPIIRPPIVNPISDKMLRLFFWTYNLSGNSLGSKGRLIFNIGRIAAGITTAPPKKFTFTMTIPALHRVTKPGVVVFSFWFVIQADQEKLDPSESWFDVRARDPSAVDSIWDNEADAETRAAELSGFIPPYKVVEDRGDPGDASFNSEAASIEARIYNKQKNFPDAGFADPEFGPNPWTALLPKLKSAVPLINASSQSAETSAQDVNFSVDTKALTITRV